MDLFSYECYRSYLKDFYQFKKEENPSYSYAVFSKLAGIASANYLKLVMDGKRGLNSEMAEKFAKGLNLSGKQAIYFYQLVELSNAKDNAVRESILLNISSLRFASQLKKKIADNKDLGN